MKTILFIFIAVFLAASVNMKPDLKKRTNGTVLFNKSKVEQVLGRFRKAIISKNREKAAAMLSSNARILEGGGIETKEQYLNHHFQSDSKFLSAMERKIQSKNVTVKNNTAWITTKSIMSGTYNREDIRMHSAELAVLIKTQKDKWKVSAIHWSLCSN